MSGSAPTVLEAGQRVGGGVVLLLAALGALGPLSIDMYLPALPTIGSDLGAGVGGAQSSLAAYFAGLAVGQLVIGPLSDRWGRSRPLAWGLLLYVIGSVGSALAPGVEALAAWRFVQALGGAAAMVVPRAIIRDRQTGNAAARTVSLLAMVGACAPIIAPTLGGLLLPLGGWRCLFAVLAVVGAGLLLVVPGRFREEPGAAPAPAPGGLAGSLAALLGDRTFLACMGAGSLGTAAMFAYIAGSPEVVITIHGVPPGWFGAVFLIHVLAMVGASQANRLLLRRWSLAAILRRGALATPIAGAALVLAAWSGWGGLAGVIGGAVLVMASNGLIGINVSVLALEAHGARAGLASAVMGSLQFAVAAAASWAIGALHDGTAMPMAWVMAACIGGSGACAALAVRGRRTG